MAAWTDPSDTIAIVATLVDADELLLAAIEYDSIILAPDDDKSGARDQPFDEI